MTVVRSEKIPPGSAASPLRERLRIVSPVSPAKSPAWSELIPCLDVPKPLTPNDVIAARCAAVTSAQTLMPAISARITSWIFAVRSQMPVVWACAGRANAPESASSAAAVSAQADWTSPRRAAARRAKPAGCADPFADTA